MKLEDQDWRLLRILQEDGRITNQDLADRAGMSASACWRRVRALEGAGVIRRYAALLDNRKAGLDFHAIVHVQLVRHSRENVQEFVDEVTRCPEVQACYATSGVSDYHLRVLCRDQDAYNAFLERFLFRLSGVANVQTNIVLREIKADASPGG
ncbi:Lrp/AsnC family transcriptional regulator [Plastorhodobacter daqingensis]|uniref:Lrp/AsnC family transcriptional regulator n=1 Tax=Plastorhodobacter daqingensis TaxID=1387281 RepID=A0ABW2ULN0_9RHOB